MDTTVAPWPRPTRRRPHRRRRNLGGRGRRERRSLIEADGHTMTGMGTPTVGEILAAAARSAAEALDGRNLRLSATGRIHAVGQVAWLGGVAAPGPLCHIGTSAGPVASIIPTEAAVTCARCLSALGVAPEQPPLYGLDTLEGAPVAA